ncbi:MAG: hypothetical protein AAF423_04160 [Pseudomonadota bacterium]
MLWEMSSNEWIISLTVFSCVTYICGYLIDSIAGSTAFGTVGNWILTLCGVYSGILGLNLYGYEMHWFPVITLSAIVGAAAFTLVFMCVLKRYVFA